MKVFTERMEVSFVVGLGTMMFLLTTVALLIRH